MISAGYLGTHKKPVESTTKFLGRPWGPMQSMVTKPKGWKILRLNVPVASNDPRDLSENVEVLLQIGMKLSIPGLVIWVPSVDTIDRNKM